MGREDGLRAVNLVDAECAQCRFSRPTISDNPEEGPILKCHRYPPTLMVIDDEVIQAYPDANEWCGEFDHG
jgi:hypothetical protein